MKNFMKMAAVFGLGVFVGKIKSIEFIQTKNDPTKDEDTVHGIR